MVIIRIIFLLLLSGCFGSDERFFILELDKDNRSVEEKRLDGAFFGE